jgi:hypothetical protein
MVVSLKDLKQWFGAMHYVIAARSTLDGTMLLFQ